jgi:hypothetical protein
MSFPKNSAFEDRERVADLVREGFESAGPPVQPRSPQPGLREVPTAVLEEWSGRLREATDYNAGTGRLSVFHADGLEQLADDIESYLPG